MNVSARVLKAHLWAAWAVTGGATVTPPATPPPLQPYLQAQAAGASGLLAAGQIKSNSANGHTTEFSGSLDSEQVVQIWVYLSELFDLSQAEVIAAGTATIPGSPTDTEIKAQMEINLRPIYGATDNYMWLIK